MKRNYLSNPSYNYEGVNRASLACGPMVKWAIAQVRKPRKDMKLEDVEWVKRVLLLTCFFYNFPSLIMLTC